MFYAGDTFDLNLYTANPYQSAVDTDQYILLDVWGVYFFWPSWGNGIDSAFRSFPPGQYLEPILHFIWPAGAGEASGINFYAALFEPGSFELYSADQTTFGFGVATPTPTITPSPTFSPTPSASPTPASYVITVPGNRQWTDSGLDVERTALWVIEGAGEICFHVGDCAGTTVGPCGTGGTDPCYDPECGAGQPFQPGFYHGALIGKIGANGSPFLVCERYDGPLPATGRLYLGINDANVSDNAMAFTATARPPR